MHWSNLTVVSLFRVSHAELVGGAGAFAVAVLAAASGAAETWAAAKAKSAAHNR
jgi:hypothetical protein